VSELIVGCYTPGAYAQVAREHLLKSLRDHDRPLACAVREMPDRGSWILNNSACQLYLRGIHDEYPDTDFLYVDVDGEVHADPWPYLRQFRGHCDVAAHFFKGKELLSGTLYLPAGPRRAMLLDAWIAMNETHPDIWDQKNLQTLVESGRFRCRQLDAEYCCIFDLQRRVTPGIKPVIEHFQASRRYKKRS
jgi:hypothetical protein